MFLSKLRNCDFLYLFYSLALSPFLNREASKQQSYPLAKGLRPKSPAFSPGQMYFLFTIQLYSFHFQVLQMDCSPHFPSLFIPSISWSSKSVSLSPRTATDGVLRQVRARETGFQRDWLRVESHPPALSVIEGLSKRFWPDCPGPIRVGRAIVKFYPLRDRLFSREGVICWGSVYIYIIISIYLYLSVYVYVCISIFRKSIW